MSRRVRLLVFSVSAAALAVVLAFGLAGLPRFGHYHGVYGITLAHVTVAQRHATDVITAINFDYRGLDTMGEEFILFAASIGVVVLLREQRGERRDEDSDAEESIEPAMARTSPALSVTGRWLVGPALVLGVYIASHGQLTPGGGFQGGVVLAAAVIVVFVAGSHLGLAAIRPSAHAERLEALGAGGYVAVGIGGLISGGRFLTNFLPLGTTRQLLSSGTIAPLSVVVGLEVAGAITLIVAEFVDQRLLVGARTLPSEPGGRSA